MAIVFSCGTCGQRFRAKEERAGTRSKCPACGREIEIPSVVATIESQTSPVSSPPPFPRVDSDRVPSSVSPASRKYPILWLATAGGILISIGFIGGLACARRLLLPAGQRKGSTAGKPRDSHSGLLRHHL